MADSGLPCALKLMCSSSSFGRGQKRRYTASYPQVPLILTLQGFEALLVPTDCRSRADGTPPTAIKTAKHLYYG